MLVSLGRLQQWGFDWSREISITASYQKYVTLARNLNPIASTACDHTASAKSPIYLAQEFH
jgi:hypothetical protein